MYYFRLNVLGFMHDQQDKRHGSHTWGAQQAHCTVGRTTMSGPTASLEPLTSPCHHTVLRRSGGCMPADQHCCQKQAVGKSNGNGTGQPLPHATQYDPMPLGTAQPPWIQLLEPQACLPVTLGYMVRRPLLQGSEYRSLWQLLSCVCTQRCCICGASLAFCLCTCCCCRCCCPGWLRGPRHHTRERQQCILAVVRICRPAWNPQHTSA